MRVATSTAYSQGVTSMNTQNYKLNKTMLQLSSGKRIVSPSDDPAGAARVLGLNQAKSRTEQFQKNINTLKSSLQIEETALNGVVDTLQRVRELSIQANSDTYDASQKAIIGLEIQEHFEAITAFANTTNGNGEFLFGGFNSRDVPFENIGGVVNYNGDQGQQFLQVSATRQIASGDNGFDVFMNVRGSDNANPASTAPMSVFAVVKELETLLRTSQGTAPETFRESMSRTIGNIDKALGQIADKQSGIGARLNATESQENVNEDYLVQLATTLSETQDLDYTEAISRLEREQIGLQASQQTFTKIQGLSLFNFI
ncbi:flagellar hook-associated protein FlgL [sulfur-oxidizing endosymbiont of Gigantopelta aegis]|uniref:flagellar hook-associated protein FlgL n=1 Tax=sulfur-oxidizing endosymbiont of Gigantopelta aegis TaxID=2794934 RepID=UPI0018DC8A88|nr:flagellar hook-associated protein FlgL [sulfur-oxidizing endosymbiont of Gigantopelta aegis]